MLSRERYQEALIRLGTIAKEGSGVDEETRHLMFSEQWLTQRALLALGTTELTPSEIPQVNCIHYPSVYAKTEEPKVIEVLGMPNSGKTTLLENFPGDSIAEAYCQLFPKGVAIDSIEALSRTADELALYRQQVMGSGSKGKIYPLERGEIDIRVLSRIFFLQGKLSGSDFIRFSPPNNKAPTIREWIGGLVVCLVAPEESDKRSSSKIFNLQELRIFYEQYLRLYHELVTQSPDIPFVCLDCSGSLEQNQIIFNQTIKEMAAFLGGSICNTEESTG